MNGSLPIFPVLKHLPAEEGFTLVELTVTMVIVVVLAAAVAPRFYDVDVFQTRGFVDQVQATLRYAQKAAIAQRRYVCAAFTASPDRLALTVGTTSACGTALNLPAGSVNYIDAPSGISFSMTPASVNFDALGRPNAAASAIVGTNNTITVEAETGYVHQ